MFRNLLQIALRRLWQQKLFSLINALGLSLGMAAFLLITQYLRHEWSYDGQSPYAGQIWRAYNETLADGEVLTQDANTHSALGPALKQDLPEVVDYTRLYNRNENSVTFVMPERPIKLEGAWMVDAGFLRMFPQQFLQGDPKTCLEEPYQIVLTQSAASLLFPAQKAMGKILQISGGTFAGNYTVSGIVADPPSNTHLKFNVLFSFESRYAAGFEDNWGGYWEYNYFQLSPGANLAKVTAQLDKYSNTHLKSAGIRLNMQPLKAIHRGSNLTYEIEPNVDPRTLRMLALIALFILGIAFVNYINLSTARAIERAKEVGMRKVIGAKRIQLIAQFLLEGFIVNASAMVFALMMVQGLSPAFAQLTGRDLLQAPGYDAIFWMSSAGVLLLGLVLAGLYPAFILSAYPPAEVLKGRWAGSSKGGNLRKALVVVQFACSIAMIISVLVVQKQLSFMRNFDLGVSLEQIVSLKTPSFNWQQDSMQRSRMAVLKNEINKIPGVRGITTSEIVPGLGISTISGSSGGMYWTKTPSAIARSTMYALGTDPEFFSTFGIDFLAGSFYQTADPRHASENLIINTTAMRALGFPNPQAAIGEQIAYQGNTDGYRMTIRGVVSDFHIESLKEPARPTLYYCLPSVQNGYLSLKFDAAQASNLLPALNVAWKKVFPRDHLDYWFLDQQFGQQYQAEQRLAVVFSLFAALAVGIACLGLFGLAAYLAVQRRKEVGVRKTLGAGVGQIVALLSSDFLKLVLVAIVIGAPLAWYAMNQWLEGFAHRIDFQWYFIPLAGLMVVLIAFLAVGSQSVRAALENPVDALRGE
ncbi:MAG TPA: ABC transporter permease [Haliscomenobacter sp.]|uniref:ABC transporter permease n=1 Tax=Haliscomenobacter sp. TaxID=2717303 RepID=UPI002B5E6D1F|nr:ABC transporter permease [Haliscomenobacter sp.]HOY16018.1 ABC transporter permease [Haliscomenobacter sp.]HPH17308.1 ABC transporter permease [Haliscomenobacter sp.]